jgi:hypothetical protein
MLRQDVRGGGQCLGARLHGGFSARRPGEFGGVAAPAGCAEAAVKGEAARRI